MAGVAWLSRNLPGSSRDQDNIVDHMHLFTPLAVLVPLLVASLALCTQPRMPLSPKEARRRFDKPFKCPPFCIREDTHNMESLLGTGSHAHVYLFSSAGKSGACPEQVAVKVVTTMGTKQEVIDDAIKEIRLLSVLDHPNVVKMYSGYKTRDSVVMVCEYFPQGSLEQYEYGKPMFGTLCTERKLKIAKGLFKAIEYLHSLGVLHLDIKPANVMLHEDSVKLIDFGFSTPPTDKDVRHHRFCGSPFYIAPEMFLHLPYTKGPDIWSAGVTLWFLCAFPYQTEAELTPECFVDKFIENFGPWSGRDRIPEELRPVIEASVQFNEEDRLSATSILALPCFSEPAASQ